MDTRIKVSISGRFLLENHPTGTHRSALGFVKALLAVPDLDVSIHVHRDSIPAHVRTQLTGARLVHAPMQRGKLLRHLWEQLIFPRIDSDSIHLYLINTGPFLFPSRKQIVVVHDIYALTSKGLYSRAFVLWNSLACGLAAKRSPQIVCFTQFVKASIEEHLKIAPKKIRVIPQGPGLDMTAPFSPIPDLPEKYLLCVGSLQPHKNLRTVVEAFAHSKLFERSYKLLVIGRKQANFTDVNLPEELENAPWLIFTGYVDDGALKTYYTKASTFVYISLLEGFGLPLVESFLLGCPVITSNLSCLPEVAGGAALLVNPLDAIAVGDAMVQLLTDENLRASLVEKGKARALAYTWESAGAAFAETICTVSQSAYP